jgi:ComF family protein
VTAFFSDFATWLLPLSCALCGDAVTRGRVHLCDACRATLPRNANQCPCCAVPTPQSELCGACLKKPPAFDATFCAYQYAFPLNRLIQNFKYGKKLALTHTLSALLIDGIHQEAVKTCDAVMAMPLAPARQIERGFNQSHEIAKNTARVLGLPYRHRALMRIKDAPKQATLTLQERKKNVRDAFLCRKPIPNEHILLIDDVMTTGATAHAAATALRKAGAARVTVAVIARTI